MKVEAKSPAATSKIAELGPGRPNPLYNTNIVSTWDVPLPPDVQETAALRLALAARLGEKSREWANWRWLCSADGQAWIRSVGK